jgi:hypothetical protein
MCKRGKLLLELWNQDLASATRTGAAAADDGAGTAPRNLHSGGKRPARIDTARNN